MFIQGVEPPCIMFVPRLSLAAKVDDGRVANDVVHVNVAVTHHLVVAVKSGVVVEPNFVYFLDRFGVKGVNDVLIGQNQPFFCFLRQSCRCLVRLFSLAAAEGS